MSELGLSVVDLSHHYGRTVALSSIALTADRGVMGLLGPNGAGKSTLFSVIGTLTPPQSGQVKVVGHDLGSSHGRRRARNLLGILPQRFTMVGSMRVADVVAYSAWCHGVPLSEAPDAADQALERVDMVGLHRRRVRQLSGGQRQRAGIACAIAHQPRVLLLDEPTVGLDPQVRLEFREVIRGLGERSLVMVSTHLVEDIAHTADRVLVLNRGSLVLDDTVASLAAAAAPGAGSDLERGYLQMLTNARAAGAGEVA